MTYKAVLTADVENSTRLDARTLERVLAVLQEELRELKQAGMLEGFELYRGDSAQAVVARPSQALKAAFRIKTAINRLDRDKQPSGRGQAVLYNIRIAVGVGEAEERANAVMTNDEPFVLSGKGLNEISGKKMSLGVFTSREVINREMAVELYLFDWIMQQWSLSSAGVIYEKLQDKTERQIAGEMNISQPAVNQRSSAACWNGLALLLRRYETLIGEYYD